MTSFLLEGESAPTPADRLRQLEAVHREGLVSDSEYAERRRAIVAEL